jgi:hypothetical protein
VKARSPASASFTVYGSLSHTQQTRAVIVGIRNVITVASANSSQESESIHVN